MWLELRARGCCTFAAHDVCVKGLGCPATSQHGAPAPERIHAQAQVHPKRTSGIVVYQDASGTKHALAAGKKGAVVDFPCDTTDDDGPSIGLRRKVETHKAMSPGNAKLQKQLDNWIAEFEDEEERKRKAADEAAADDGWTLVTKGAGRKRKHGALCLRTLMVGRTQLNTLQNQSRELLRALVDVAPRNRCTGRLKGHSTTERAHIRRKHCQRGHLASGCASASRAQET